MPSTAKEIRAVNASPAGVKFGQLLAALRDVICLADELAEEHPDGCACAFCSDCRMDVIRPDLAGAAWACGYAESTLQGETMLDYENGRRGLIDALVERGAVRAAVEEYYRECDAGEGTPPPAA